MNEQEIQEVLDELHKVRPEKLNDKGKRLFNAIMSIADERDLYKQRIERAIQTMYDKGTLMSIADERDLYKQRIERAIQTMYDKGTFNLDNEYGEVFLEMLEILEGNDNV